MDTIIQFDDGSLRDANILDDIEDIDTIVIDDGRGESQFLPAAANNGRFSLYDSSSEHIYPPQGSISQQGSDEVSRYTGIGRSDSRNSVASSVRSASGQLTDRRKPQAGSD
ncbi:hypothetical protein EV182_002290 [Spiromyces aspiralis]|uniref:Uncharacterized protein n=1 Tax=Spiromyces aspiralis TaxID=68401 RepID=A0ACC1HRZ1_9FUNG|nr:hypothetical protein EV182_002290 [Spiromyces aspiralis]